MVWHQLKGNKTHVIESGCGLVLYIYIYIVYVDLYLLAQSIYLKCVLFNYIENLTLLQ